MPEDQGRMPHTSVFEWIAGPQGAVIGRIVLILGGLITTLGGGWVATVVNNSKQSLDALSVSIHDLHDEVKVMRDQTVSLEQNSATIRVIANEHERRINAVEGEIQEQRQRIEDVRDRVTTLEAKRK